MMIAQKLYEGIELEDETVGLITYMRTDSVRFSDEFISSCYKYIDDEYGLLERARFFNSAEKLELFLKIDNKIES